MKKRSCKRFILPGTTLYFKKKPKFFGKGKYSKSYYPVINLSKGGAKFLCDKKMKAGTAIVVKFEIPGQKTRPEIISSVRWISRNPEKSYRYRTGIAFNSYGRGKNENPREILALMESFEKQYRGENG